MQDIDASAHRFFQQLREQADAFREGVKVAKLERDEANARLADAEAKLAHTLEAMRAMRVYTGEGTEPPEEDLESQGESSSQEGAEISSIEAAIFEVLGVGVWLSSSEITRKVEALGVSSSAGSVRARLSKLRKQGIVQQDSRSKYSVSKPGSGASRS
ncbi:hypothetical protein [Streptomyces microflavus]|uniref:hypothetical protein n=1 Tax=Streptomyces microflavus TaxID=1919 RepID=UPI002E35B3A4|nr:hypothetical protein [Streptomyces microflavus]